MVNKAVSEAISEALRDFRWHNYSFHDVSEAIETDTMEWAVDLAGEIVGALEEAHYDILHEDNVRNLNTWYRSTKPDGSVWCESTDPEEIRSERHTGNTSERLTFWKSDHYLVDGVWVPWEI